MLSEYLGGKSYDELLNKTLFIINKKVNVVEIFKTHGLQPGRKELEKQYDQFRNEIPIKQYVSAINPVAKFLFPTEFTTNNKTTGNAAIVKCQKPKKVVFVNQGNTQINKKTPTPKMGQVQTPIPGGRTPLNPNDVKSISVGGKARSFYLACSKNNEIYLMNDLTKQKTDFDNTYLYGDTLSMDIFNDKEMFTLYVPKKKYKSIILSISAQTISLFPTEFMERVETKELSIDSPRASIFGNLKVAKMVVKNCLKIKMTIVPTKSVNINAANTIDINAFGNITSFKTNFKMRNQKGKIILRLLNFTKLKIHTHLRRLNQLKGKFYHDLGYISMNLKSNKGRVIIGNYK